MNTIETKIYSLEPVLAVNDLRETLEYYQNILGFGVDWTWPDDGTVEHASVTLGSGHGDGADHDDHHAHIQLSQAEEKPVANSGWLYFRVKENIDTLYEELKKRGANIVTELGNRPWGMREFEIRENNGHCFRFAHPAHDH